MAIKIATLFAEVTATTRDFDRKIDATEGRADRLSRKFQGLGRTAVAAGATITAIGSAFVLAANRAAEYADRIDKTSERTGLARDTLQELDFVTSQLGSSMEDVEKAIKGFTTQIPAIQSGTSETAREFAKLGISLYDSSGALKDMSVLFPETLRALSEMGNETERNAIALKVFGARAGQSLFPVLNAGATKIEELTARAHELGLILSDEGVKSLVTYKDKVDELKRAIDAGLTKAVSENIDDINEWIGAVAEGVPTAISNALPALERLGKTLGVVGGLLGFGGVGGFKDALKQVAGFNFAEDFLANLERGLPPIMAATAAFFGDNLKDAILKGNTARYDPTGARFFAAGGGGGSSGNTPGGSTTAPSVPGPVAAVEAQRQQRQDTIAELERDVETFEDLDQSAQTLATTTFEAGQALRTVAAVSMENAAAGADASRASLALANAQTILAGQIPNLITGFGYAAAEAIRLGEGFAESLRVLAAQLAGQAFGQFLGSFIPIPGIGQAIGQAGGQIFAALAGPRQERVMEARVGVDSLYFTTSQRTRFTTQ